MDESAELPSKTSAEKPEPTPNHVETPNTPQPEKENLEDSEKFGIFYKSLLNEALGNGETDTTVLEGSNERTRALADSITLTAREYKHKEHLLASVKSMQGLDFMQQAFPQNEALESADIELQELSEGIYAVSIDTDSFSKIYNNSSQAVAIKVPDGVSFIMIRKYGEESEATKRDKKENIPHEVNHLVWNYLKKDKIVQCDEEDPEVNKAYQMYQDELAAKLVSDGALISYTHLQIVSPEERARLQNDNPTIVEQIKAKQIELNNVLEEIGSRGGSQVKKDALLLPLIRARNFYELKQALLNTRNIIPQVEQTTQQSNSSWDSV